MTEIVLIFGTLFVTLFTSTAFAFLGLQVRGSSQRKH